MGTDSTLATGGRLFFECFLLSPLVFIQIQTLYYNLLPRLKAVIVGPLQLLHLFAFKLTLLLQLIGQLSKKMIESRVRRCLGVLRWHIHSGRSTTSWPMTIFDSDCDDETVTQLITDDVF